MAEPKMILNNPNSNTEAQLEALHSLECGCEEFYNSCHSKANGKFCSSKDGKGGKNPVKGAGRILRETKANAQQRKASPDLRKTTTSIQGTVLKTVLNFVNPLGGVGAVAHLPKLRALQKADISKFKSEDLQFLRQQLIKDQSRNMVSLVVNAATLDAIGVGYISWRAKRTPPQISRIESELNKRNVKFDSIVNSLWAFASEDSLPSLAQEIATARKQIADGTLPKPTRKPSAKELKEYKDWLNDLKSDPDAGLTPTMVRSMKDSLEKYEKMVKS